MLYPFILAKETLRMRKKEAVELLRRDFLLSSSLMLLGAGSLGASVLQSKDSPKGPDLSESLSEAELEMASHSAIAKDMDNYWHKGYSCAETGLMVTLRFMKKPEDLVWAAGGFGGGMGHQDLCGFLTAGFMAIGLYAGSLNLGRQEASMRCSRMTSEYWNWWASTAPMHCREIREGRRNFDVCHRLGKLASVKLEGILKA
jgi:hypothetical protein